MAKKPKGRASGLMYLPKIKLKNRERSKSVNISISLMILVSTETLSKYRYPNVSTDRKSTVATTNTTLPGFSVMYCIACIS